MDCLLGKGPLQYYHDTPTRVTAYLLVHNQGRPRQHFLGVDIAPIHTTVDTCPAFPSSGAVANLIKTKSGRYLVLLTFSAARHLHCCSPLVAIYSNVQLHPSAPSVPLCGPHRTILHELRGGYIRPTQYTCGCDTDSPRCIPCPVEREACSTRATCTRTRSSESCRTPAACTFWCAPITRRRETLARPRLAFTCAGDLSFAGRQ